MARQHFGDLGRLLVGRDDDDEELGLLGEVLERGRRSDAVAARGGKPLRIDVEGGDLMAALRDEMACHRGTHLAHSNDADLHALCFLINRGAA